MKQAKTDAIKRALEQAPRKPLTALSRELNIPVSTIFAELQRIEKTHTLKGEWQTALQYEVYWEYERRYGDDYSEIETHLDKRTYDIPKDGDRYLDLKALRAQLKDILETQDGDCDHTYSIKMVTIKDKIIFDAATRESWQNDYYIIEQKLAPQIMDHFYRATEPEETQ